MAITQRERIKRIVIPTKKPNFIKIIKIRHAALPSMQSSQSRLKTSAGS